jgi:hypothetical protein
MRRFVSFVILVFCALPFGISLNGCHKATPPTYCNGQTSGVIVGTLVSLDLQPRLTGISLNQGEIGRMNSPSGRDCRGESASTSSVIYSSSNIKLADVDSSTGALCAGSWNRNTGAAIPDYTVCTPTTTSGIAYLTASSSGVSSNAIPVFIHPIVTSIVLGPASINCTTDPASNCVDLNIASGFASGPVINPPASYDGSACLSQGVTAQLVARTFAGNGTAATNNISNLVGPLSFTALNASVVTVDANGVATAAQPGSSTISANISQASSTAGFFSTCPPQTIVLTTPNASTPPTGPISVNQNTTQSLTAIVTDTKGKLITNVQLTYVSTSPTTIPASSNSIVPTYPGAATITAICQPPTCNTSPFNEIGLFGNGTTVNSNPVQIIATGANFSSVIYIGSTNSQYILPIDFTVTTQPAPVRLPYAPNSMVISQDLSTIYMGTATEIMIFATGTNSLSKQDNSVAGNVIAVSPDNGTAVITDPVRKLVFLYGQSSGITGEYGGVATRAAWSPDSATVYITTTDGRMLVHSTFTGWTVVNPVTAPTDVAVTVPSAGVYLGGNPVDVRTNCPQTTVSGTGLGQTTTNNFYPDLGPVPAANAIRVAATSDGLHILGANASTFTDIVTNTKSGGCPVTFISNPRTPIPLTGATVDTTVNNTIFTSGVANLLITSDSAFAFLTYTGSGGVVPQYAPATGGYTAVKLQTTAAGAPQSPVSGAVSADNGTLFVGTTGDNLVHRLTRGMTGFSDTLTPIAPALPAFNGTGIATPDLLVQKPRKATS